MGAAVAALAGCAPELPTTAPPTYAEMQFDPTKGLAPAPTQLVINPQTAPVGGGTIDFSLAGVTVPSDCATETAMPVAACEFYQYLQSLDGFPTVSTGTAPASEEIDLASVTVPQNLFVYDHTSQQTLTQLAVGWDAATSSLTFFPAGGWNIGTRYDVAIRGYANGVKATSGHEVIGSTIYFFLKSDESLTCGTSADQLVSESCAYYSLVAQPGQTQTEVSVTLQQLEGLRQLWALLFGLWDEDATKGNMPKSEVAVTWSFPTHTASVVELMPPLGMVPAVVGTKEIDLKAKGSIKADTLAPFSLASPDGSVVLLDLTVLQSSSSFPPPPEAVPAFTPTFANGNIVLTTEADLVPGHLYGIMLLTRITNDAGQPIVASPLTVMLKSTGELVDANGKSQVPNVDDASAQEAEAGRLQLKPLLDQLLPLVGLSRADIAYMYAFTPIPAP
jgi:hypothetical protein